MLSKIAKKEYKKEKLEIPINILIAAYNEQDNIIRKLDNCFGTNYPKSLISIVLVSDGSNDKTVELAKKYNNGEVKVVECSDRKGKAYCLNEGFKHCDKSIVVFMDMRQSIEKDSLVNLISNLSDNNIVGVSGELYFYESDTTSVAPMGIYWNYEKFIRRSESLFDSCVGATGAFYAVKRSEIKSIPNQTVLDDVLIPMNAILNDSSRSKRIVYDSSASVFDVPPSDMSNEKRRKVRTIAGNHQLLQLRPELLSLKQNRLFFQFFSHKILRLLSPLFLFMLFLSTLFLSASYPLFLVLTVLQIIIYLFWWFGSKIEPLKSSIIFKLFDAFLSLNYFAALGFKEFKFNKSLHIWKK